MYNPERGSFTEAIVMACAGIVVSLLVLHFFNIPLGWKIAAGAAYGLLSYGLWWAVVTYAGSLVCEDDDESEVLTAGTGALSFCLPPAALVVLIIIVGSGIGWLLGNGLPRLLGVSK